MFSNSLLGYKCKNFVGYILRNGAVRLYIMSLLEVTDMLPNYAAKGL